VSWPPSFESVGRSSDNLALIERSNVQVGRISSSRFMTTKRSGHACWRASPNARASPQPIFEFCLVVRSGYFTLYEALAPFPGASPHRGLRAHPNDVFAWGHSTDAVRGANSHWFGELDRQTRARSVNWRWRHTAGIPWIGRCRQLPVRTAWKNSARILLTGRQGSPDRCFVLAE